eukprot:CAMPEP_0196589574 /NCGR_PEP_ID=MMETSP1081-20130531/63961_1 /TAXON_ID=36882 /ORGANISM="Pyramimonas amylifera, Strain CCMP720" /LENGTH=60 /DNA_ID=CAMNT_0041912419 /DNA_START=167 /DNA_END=346 /DNA_ORIENTATION=+
MALLELCRGEGATEAEVEATLVFSGTRASPSSREPENLEAESKLDSSIEDQVGTTSSLRV